MLFRVVFLPQHIALRSNSDSPHTKRNGFVPTLWLRSALCVLRFCRFSGLPSNLNDPRSGFVQTVRKETRNSTGRGGCSRESEGVGLGAWTSFHESNFVSSAPPLSFAQEDCALLNAWFSFQRRTRPLNPQSEKLSTHTQRHPWIREVFRAKWLTGEKSQHTEHC